MLQHSLVPSTREASVLSQWCILVPSNREASGQLEFRSRSVWRRIRRLAWDSYWAVEERKEVDESESEVDDVQAQTMKSNTSFSIISAFNRRLSKLGITTNRREKLRTNKACDWIVGRFVFVCLLLAWCKIGRSFNEAVRQLICWALLVNGRQFVEEDVVQALEQARSSARRDTVLFSVTSSVC